MEERILSMWVANTRKVRRGYDIKSMSCSCGMEGRTIFWG